MAKVISTLFISADGVAEIDPDWHFPYFDENMGRAVGEDYDTSDVLLIGRETYDSFAGAWPDREAAGGDDAPFAKQLGDMRKVVVSRQPLEFSWRNSELIEGDLVEAVAALKADAGIKGILIPGSISVVQQLLAAGLVDELRLLVHPVAARKGRKLFDDGDAPYHLRVTATEAFPTGVIRVIYAPTEAPAKVGYDEVKDQVPEGGSKLAPHVLGDRGDQPQLVDLLVGVEHVALDGRGEPALRREAELVERHVLRRLVDAALELVGVLHAAALGGDQPEHHLLAGRHEAQRGEAARALVVELAEEGVDVEPAEQLLGDVVVAALGDPGRAEVAAAHVGGDRHALRAVGDGGVDRADVALVRVLGVVAPRGQHLPAGWGRSGTRGWCRRAAGSGSPPRRVRGSRSAHAVGEVGPELVEIRVDGCGPRRPCRCAAAPCWARGWSSSASAVRTAPAGNGSRR